MHVGVDQNGVPLSSDEDEKADFINSLVHEDASQYFFFDGEKINDYSTASGSQYKDAIARVLGIKEIDNAVEDLHLLKKEFEKIRDAWIHTQNKYQDILQQKEEADQKVAEQEALLEQYEREINAANEQIQKDEDKLKDFKEISEKVTQKQKLSEEIKQLTEDLKRVRGEQSECFQKNATLMLAASILQNTAGYSCRAGRISHHWAGERVPGSSYRAAYLHMRRTNDRFP